VTSANEYENSEQERAHIDLDGQDSAICWAWETCVNVNNP